MFEERRHPRMVLPARLGSPARRFGNGAKPVKWQGWLLAISPQVKASVRKYRPANALRASGQNSRPYCLFPPRPAGAAPPFTLAFSAAHLAITPAYAVCCWLHA